ncbi:hypothetical protein DLAC_09207 [Tieghemostelium lacteum]|uniref:Succinate dehydrogenase assembly factor 4, mitochondrial n=1 Tax=Tieghemostelium lacteum TaxID=361077 RepID=A0A151Z9F8_TIELA|nr:hypothetical protein DLAC_09207 [Tieghemostelium lacteum]|eukprot:KYQ90577.1 hypothetical protein DLAC_09207 [Tieghemostelium lacteum]
MTIMIGFTKKIFYSQNKLFFGLINYPSNSRILKINNFTRYFSTTSSQNTEKLQQQKSRTTIEHDEDLNEAQLQHKKNKEALDIDTVLMELDQEEIDNYGKPYVNEKTGEIGGPTGPEPTRYSDWERNGRCSDF